MTKCPCEFEEIEPCHPQCTCRTPVLSAGCRRCATYGSDEQRLAAAKRLANQDDRLVRLMHELGDAKERIEVLDDALTALRQAVRDHRDARGDDRCWLDDIELYKALHEPVPEDMELALPNRNAFLTRCEQYFEHRQKPGCKPWQTVEALQEELKEKSKDIEEMLTELLAATATKAILCGQVEKLRHVLLALDEDCAIDVLVDRLSAMEDDWPSWRDPKEQELPF